MAVRIHPHKGYLNTEFHIHLNGEKQLSYEVCTKSSNPELYTDGIAEPFKPQSITINIPGEYEVYFSDGTVINILVEDAYKFGGSAFKRGFVFDKSPWSFVIMHDRTYFHNRETGEQYVEPISPDEIIEVNKEYVLFKTAQQEELTLYSLTEQKPIREFSNIIFHNENYIVTEEIEEDAEEEFLYLNIYSLKSNESIFKEQIERYDLCDEDFYLFEKYSVEHISLKDGFVKQIVSRKYEGRLIKVLDSSIAISYKEVGQTKNLYVYSLKEETTLNTIPVKGHLCSVNGEDLIDLHARIGAINRFDILKTDFPEASIQVQYDEYVFYNCGWEVFYEIKSHLISKSGCKWSSKKEIKEFSYPGGRVFKVGDYYCNVVGAGSTSFKKISKLENYYIEKDLLIIEEKAGFVALKDDNWEIEELYNTTNKDTLLASNGYNECQEECYIYNYGDKFHTFKHTFKKSSNGNYYWYSTEIEE
ncbi:MAG: hypothetical protein NC453_30170 [Muribaculum sp.]|nr:hypothetical protein [Muribaculum sp.]